MSFIIQKNYITHKQADELQDFAVKLFYNSGPTRAIARFGKTNSYSSDKVSDKIPEELQWLIRKLEVSGSVDNIGHVTINRYLPLQTIPPHIDNHEAGDIITILSIGSDCTMLFTGKKDNQSHFVPANSLVQFMDDLRWKYKHTVKDIISTRYSFVFRKH
jgi:alkylated DNA repair dioxygenase AlkB